MLVVVLCCICTFQVWRPLSALLSDWCGDWREGRRELSYQIRTDLALAHCSQVTTEHKPDLTLKEVLEHSRPGLGHSGLTQRKIRFF